MSTMSSRGERRSEFCAPAAEPDAPIAATGLRLAGNMYPVAEFSDRILAEFSAEKNAQDSLQARCRPCGEEENESGFADQS